MFNRLQQRQGGVYNRLNYYGQPTRTFNNNNRAFDQNSDNYMNNNNYNTNMALVRLN